VQIAPQIEPGAGIESRAGLVQQQDAGLVQQPFGDLDSFRFARLSLWDETQNRLVSFDESRISPNKQ
jgi:hypothetical protein